MTDSLRSSAIDSYAKLAQEGCVIVCPSQRLRHLVTDSANLRFEKQGLECWPTLDIFTWSGWLSHLWSAFELAGSDDFRQLLSPPQAQTLWEDCIDKSIQGERRRDFEYLLWHVNSTADTARKAYALMCAYGIEARQFENLCSEDADNFLKWRADYRKIIEKRSLIDHETLPDAIAEHAHRACADGEAKIVWAGFDELTPQQEKLAKALRDSGADLTISGLSPASAPEQALRVEFDTLEQEIEGCARWARAVVEKNPESKVGIVACDLNSVQVKLQRTFAAVMNPDAMLESRQSQRFGFHLTLGDSLTDIPLIADALNLIRLIGGDVKTEVMCEILRSDRIKDWEEEGAARSRLAAEVLERCGTVASIADVLRIAPRKDHDVPSLVKLLRKAEKLSSNMPAKAEYGQWARIMQDWMQCFQASTRVERTFGADEFQSHKQWGRIIDQLAQLGFVHAKVSARDAISKLARIASSTTYQPQATRVPVQIGSPLALQEQDFTHLWIMGMHNEAVPGASRPNPFIPMPVQRKHNLPDSSPAERQQRTQRTMDALMTSGSVVMSFAKHDGNRDYEPSSLFSAGAQTDPKRLPRHDGTGYDSLIAAERRRLEAYSSWQAPQVIRTGAKVRGGSQILRNQSNCPFLAFARHRLRAENPEVLESGFSALERGSFVHKLLEAVYSKYGDKTALGNAIETPDFAQLLESKSRDLLTGKSWRRIRPLADEIVENEIERLVNLAQEWCEQDLERDGDFSLDGIEQEFDVHVGELQFKIVVDRVDKLDDGSRMVIDYKTGRPSLKDLFSERPKDPQLLIYYDGINSSGDSPVEAVAYGQVRKLECRLMRFPLENPTTPNQHSDHDAQSETLAAAHSTLSSLAQDFLDGDAVAKPLPDACEHCDIGPICRIREVEDRS